MKSVAIENRSLFNLVGDLRDEAKTLIRQEIELAKVELREKARSLSRNGIWLAAGASVAYAGLIVILAGVGCLIAAAFVALGLTPLVAAFVGLGIAGLAVALIGLGFVIKALKAFSHQPIAPERTLHTIQELRGNNHVEREARHRARPPAARPSSAEMESLVDSTQKMMKETAAELKLRLTPKFMARRFAIAVRKHPVRSGMVAAGTSLAGLLMLRRRFRHA